MKGKLLGLALLAAWPLAAQLNVFVVTEDAEQPLGETHSVGTAAVGNFIDTTFRIRNTSDLTLRAVMNVAGTGFDIPGEYLPAWPPDIPGGNKLDFVVRFQPQTPGSYSAYLNINGERMSILYAVAIPGVTLSVQEGASVAELTAGDAIEFGSVVVGMSAVRRFELSNPTDQSLTVNTLAAIGTAFRGPLGLQAPLTLQPQQKASFEIVFEPKSAGFASGSIELDQRSYSLRGTGIEADYPKPQILIDPPTLTGGRQAKVRVTLESASRYAGEGGLSLELKPAVATKGDPAVLFLATGALAVKFQVSQGKDACTFTDRTETEFQAGTTAGTLVFTAKLGKHVVEQRIEIPASPVVVDLTKVLRSATGLEVKVTGFDTSRTASRVSFTFFDRDWNIIAPGAIGADVAAAFGRYFETAEMGGMFLLRAVFPVNGNALKIVAVEVEFANAHGATRTPRVGIP